MLDFFNQLKIKHADLPFVFVYWGLFFLLIIVGLFIAKIAIVILMAICSLPILIVSLHYHFYRANEELAIRQQKKYQAYFSLYNLIDFRLPIPYMTGWAATPELALMLYEIIKTEKPTNIVELGSGVSSLICAYTIEQNKHGALFSMDHNKTYAKKTEQMLLKHGVNEQATICHTPLKNQEIEGRHCIWYDCSAIKCPESIDLLIVDGPPLQTQDKARYPALNYFAHKLSASATIIIHDALRQTETAIIEKSLQEHADFHLRTIHSEKGIGVLKRG